MPWWGKSSPSSEEKPTESPPASDNNAQPPFDPDKLPEARKLPKGLQKIVDKSDKDSSFFDDIADG